jgi:hypothetical protein
MDRRRYAVLLASQSGVCAICNRADPRRILGVDHDHLTGRTRGLLCHRCNTGIGMISDAPQRLHFLVRYLLAQRTADWVIPQLLRTKTTSPAWRHHGMVRSQYDTLVDSSGGACMACGHRSNVRDLHIDHEHKTGHIRGLLCRSCNQTLGFFKDSSKLLLRAVGYLRGYMKFSAPQSKHPAQTSLWTQIELR